MKIKAIIVIVAIVAFVSAAIVVNQLAGRRDSTKFELVKLDWTPPKSAIDSGYVAAAKQLLGNGLADPRGGRFCSVPIEIGDAARGRLDFKQVFGWVKPDGKRFVALDGVEYPVKGGAVQAEPDSVFTASSSTQGHVPRGIEISPQNAAVPALLLLVGRVDLAERVYSSTIGRFAGSSAQMLFDHLRQRYQMQAAQALMTRHDADGVNWARWMVKVCMVQDTFPLKPRFPHAPLPPSNTAFARSLFADLQRRVDSPKKEPIDLEALKKLDESTRVKALVDALDTVAAKQMGQPGGIDYMNDPVAQAVTAQGKAIVPLLIDAIENDKRLTRTVSYGRDFFPERSIHTVKSVAWNLLEFAWPAAEALQRDPMTIPEADVLRKAWSDQKGLSDEERWLAVLRDDGAGERKWLEAAEALVMPAGEVRHGSTYYNAQIGGAMKGETLRSAHNGEVIAIMSKRALQICAATPNSGMNMFACDDALRLGHCLSKWDLSAGATCLKAVCAASLETMTDRREGAANANRLGRSFAFAISDRAKSHDTTAAADFAKFCDAMDPAQAFTDDQCLRPIWEVPDDAGIQAQGVRLMAKWTKTLESTDSGAAAAVAQLSTRLLPSSPLLAVRCYREFLAAALRDSNPLGTVEMRETAGRKYIAYHLPGGGGGLWNLTPDEAPSSHEGKSRPISVGDYFAETLSNSFVKDFPAFHILWSDAKRSRAKAELATWLTDQTRDWISIAKTSGFFQMFE